MVWVERGGYAVSEDGEDHSRDSPHSSPQIRRRQAAIRFDMHGVCRYPLTPSRTNGSGRGSLPAGPGPHRPDLLRRRDKEFGPTTTREGGTLDGQRSVLIVDQSDDTREVLQTALRRRGLRILAASQAGAGLELARRHHPDLIVLDLDLDESATECLSARFAEQSRSDQTPLVMLGSIRRDHLRRCPADLPEGEFVPKPYHYGPLIRRIEELLGTTPHAHSVGRVSCPTDGIARSG